MDLVVKEARRTGLRLDKEDPEWRFAAAASPRTRGVVVELKLADGTAGYGYGQERGHLGIPIQGVRGYVDAGLAIVQGRDLADYAILIRELTHEIGGCQPALAALEIAIHDLVARAYGIPLYTLLGGKARDRIPVLRILAIKHPDEVANNARKLYDQGFRYFKVKIENKPASLDVARVRAVREAVGPDAGITVDANQSYTAKEAIRFCEAVSDYGLDIFEQPVHASDVRGLAMVTRAVSCVVEGHESAITLEAIKRLARERAVDSVNLGTRLGGIKMLQQAITVCRDEGIAWRMGPHVGSQLLAAAAVHMAVHADGLGYACELGEYERILGDPFTGLTVMDGHISPPPGPGLGVTPANPDFGND